MSNYVDVLGALRSRLSGNRDARPRLPGARDARPEPIYPIAFRLFMKRAMNELSAEFDAVFFGNQRRVYRPEPIMALMDKLGMVRARIAETAGKRGSYLELDQAVARMEAAVAYASNRTGPSEYWLERKQRAKELFLQAKMTILVLLGEDELKAQRAKAYQRRVVAGFIDEVGPHVAFEVLGEDVWDYIESDQ